MSAFCTDEKMVSAKREAFVFERSDTHTPHGPKASGLAEQLVEAEAHTRCPASGLAEQLVDAEAALRGRVALAQRDAAVVQRVVVDAHAVRHARLRHEDTR